MKNLSKIISILLFVILAVNVQAEGIDECKSDLYYANGIMMKYSEKDALDMWKDEADTLLVSKPKIYPKIANIKISYNISQGFLDDLLESFEQVMNNEWGWKEFSLYFAVYLKEKGIQEDWVPHIKDLVKQTKSYKESIKLGHNVIVIAHSQGNYYTNESYELLDDWMKPYFYMMGVATPANHVAGFATDDTTAPYVKFHNDFIKSVVTGLPSNRVDPNSKHNQTFSIAAHDFYESYLSADNTRTDIINFIESKVIDHAKAPSQWETDQEFDRNTCNYKITVKHRFDPSIEMGEKVYPFNGSKKLYQVKGEYVKASCGGENILSAWEGKHGIECLKIDNIEEEKIYRRQSFSSCVLKLETEYCKLQDWSGGVWEAKTKERCLDAPNWYLPLNGCHFSKPGGEYYNEPNGTDCDPPPNGWVIKSEKHIPEYDEWLGAHGYNSLDEQRVGDIKTIDECKFHSSLWYAGWGSSLIGKIQVGLQRYHYYERIYVPK